MRFLDSITDSMETDLSKLREILEDRGACHATTVCGVAVRHNLATEQLPSDVIYIESF